MFARLYRCWCHHPIALIALCLLARAYDHTQQLVTHCGTLDITVDFLTEIDKLIQFIESPIFACKLHSYFSHTCFTRRCTHGPLVGNASQRAGICSVWTVNDPPANRCLPHTAQVIHALFLFVKIAFLQALAVHAAPGAGRRFVEEGEKVSFNLRHESFWEYRLGELLHQQLFADNPLKRNR